jgi:tetratricopeptide (TPR) repeat protein
MPQSTLFPHRPGVAQALIKVVIEIVGASELTCLFLAPLSTLNIELIDVNKKARTGAGFSRNWLEVALSSAALRASFLSTAFSGVDCMTTHSNKLLSLLRGRLRLMDLVTCPNARFLMVAVAVLLMAKSPVPVGSSAEPTSGPDDQAAKRFVEAEELRGQWEEQALRKAIEKYDEAASLWHPTTPGKSAEALQNAGDVYFILSDYKKALTSYERALEISRNAGNQVMALEALNSIGYAYIYLGENKKGLSYAMKVSHDCKRLPLAAAAADTMRRLEAEALNNIGEAYYGLGDLKGSLKVFAQALELYTVAKDRRGLALVQLNLGYSHTDIGDLQEAAENFRQSLSLWQEMDDRRGGP